LQFQLRWIASSQLNKTTTREIPFLQERQLGPLSCDERECCNQLNQAVSEHWQDWELSEEQARSIARLPGQRKVAALAGALRTLQFMQRYYNDVSTRDERLARLQVRLCA
jgi:hypothetical protein